MKKHLLPRLDNRGASLIMVIIGITFVIALGAIAVSAALTNNEMKSVDRKSKYNFYRAEAAMDEIRTGLEEDVAESLSDSYKELMTNYLAKDANQRWALFHDNFVADLMEKLNVNVNSKLIDTNKLKAYLKQTEANTKIIGTPEFDETENPDYIKLKAIAVRYQSDEYTTSITTDIKIDIPKAAESNSQVPFLDYAVIADEMLSIDKSGTGESTYNITGSLYAGSQGIHTGYSKKVVISGSNIIVKGSIVVNELGDLQISGPNMEVWADNLITTQNERNKDPDPDYVTKLSMKGSSENGSDCSFYIKDDLVLDAGYSEVNLKGNYYGYSSGTDADTNSSVIINASGADLNLSGLDKLYLAGRSFLSLEEGKGAVYYQHDDVFGAGDKANCDILTGESLAIKGNQNAYLLPGKYIAVGHNPVSWNEFTYYYKNNLVLVSSIPPGTVVFENKDIPVKERELLYYLDATCPVKQAFYKFGNNDNVVYYYLNFKSPQKATAYFNNYMKCYPDKVYNNFPITSVKINEALGACLTAGNMITYEPGTGVKLIPGTNATFSNNYSKMFYNLTSTLQKNCSATGDVINNNIVFENIIDMDRLNQGPDGIVLEKDLDSGGYVCIVNKKTPGTFVFDRYGKKGIIVANCDIDVDKAFTGLIISNGAIHLNAGPVTAASELVDKILSTDSETAAFFKVYRVWKGGINVADLIHYENWRKKEPDQEAVQ